MTLRQTIGFDFTHLGILYPVGVNDVSDIRRLSGRFFEPDTTQRISQ